MFFLSNFQDELICKKHAIDWIVKKKKKKKNTYKMAAKNTKMTPLTAEDLKKSYSALRTTLSHSASSQKMGLTAEERSMLKKIFGDKLQHKASDSSIVTDFVTNSITNTSNVNVNF